MPHYRRVGEVPPKRHTQFRTPDGGLYAEELIGQYGFAGASSLLYHRRPPTTMVRAPRAEDLAGPGEADTGDDLRPNHPLSPYHLRTGEVPTGDDLVTGRRVLLANTDLRVAVATATSTSPFYRNADGDELVYIRSGRLRMESVFGALDCHSGDYVVVPAVTTHRWLPADDGPAHALILELRGHVGPPERYLSPQGQFLEHSPYCERDLHGPDEPLVAGPTGQDDRPTDLLVSRGGHRTWFRHAHHPFDVVGWDGCVYPYRLSIHDFEPLTGRVHQPPPVHQTFAAPGVVVCSFVPRKLDYHPAAVPAPYNHSNVDSDELLYYCDGDFTSRKGAGITPGSLTLHPGGHTHGPQPGSVEASLGATETNELAVMVDTFRPLQLTAAARACADPDYPLSWAPTASS
jgi:homogentisate 1,2-dioxygenase